MPPWTVFLAHTHLITYRTLFSLGLASATQVPARNSLSTFSRDSPNITEFDLSNGNTTSLAFSQPHCSNEYAEGLTVASCTQAYSIFYAWLGSLRREKVVVGPRGEGIWDMPDPMRFTSCESLFNFLTMHTDILQLIYSV